MTATTSNHEMLSHARRGRRTPARLGRPELTAPLRAVTSHNAVSG
jgi:hypothetical protein